MAVKVSSTNWLSQILRTLFRLYIEKGKNNGIIDIKILKGDKNNNHHQAYPPGQSSCTNIDEERVRSEIFEVDIDKREEVNRDIILDAIHYNDCGTLSGRVLDQCGHPIGNALVKVFNLKHEPITHVFANNDGEYLICLPPGCYFVKAVY